MAKAKKKATKRKLTARERAAYHEAGHAVMAVLLRGRLASVTIDSNRKVCKDRGAAGVTAHRKFAGNDFDEIRSGRGARKRRLIERAVQVYYAGSVAVSILVGRTDWEGAGKDLEELGDLLWRITLSEEEAVAYGRWLWIRTRNILSGERFWAMVEAVAEALLERETLTAKEVRTIMGDRVNRFWSKECKTHPSRLWALLEVIL